MMRPNTLTIVALSPTMRLVSLSSDDEGVWWALERFTDHWRACEVVSDDAADRMLVELFDPTDLQACTHVRHVPTGA